MNNEIKLCSISEILGKNFFIPSYQRGYRWTEQQVIDLLNDIYSFANKRNKSDKEFYCLQPIVVRKCKENTIKQNNLNSQLDNNTWYEIIDGQQRLTTIRILLTYLIEEHLNGKTLQSEYNKEELLLEYESREGTKEFLNNINVSKSEKYIDFYFIYKAYETITKWFSDQTAQRGVRENILRTLVYDMTNKQQEGVVQVIWYEITDNANPIDTFIRINMGKIPLTNSELIKALFLQKRNFGNENGNFNSQKETLAGKRQNEIATEWDKIEYSLQNDDFWWFLNRNGNDVSARIEFLFDIICEVAKKDDIELIKKIGTDKYSTFRYFNEKFSSEITFEIVKNEWDNVKDYFLAFEEWFSDTVWYHYIGFLIYCGTSVVDIYYLYKDSPKDSFTKKLKGVIKSKLGDIVSSKDLVNKKNDTVIDEIVKMADSYLNYENLTDNKNQKYDYNIELQFNNKDKTKIRELLLLYNLQFIVKQYEETKEKSGYEICVKFPFELFKKEKWDVEHIDSYTTNAITEKKIQVEWLRTARIDTADKLDDLKEDIINFIDSENNARSFDELKGSIIEKVGETSNDENTKNSIGNLTLLSADINRSYGNALFPTKRRIIIEKDNAGKFIPICTKNVFLKYFDRQGSTRTQWTDSDIKNHQNNIGEVLNGFFTF
jgi:uncharacterized protein with ParB-like and HNH nuclease domain/uncharacterized protein YjbJ (UPF0337 family)